MRPVTYNSTFAILYRGPRGHLPYRDFSSPHAASAQKSEHEWSSTMKRMHVHVAVDDLTKSIRFYSSLFAAEPAVVKPDYAKWMLDDPRVNFAISTRGRPAGLDHFGIQVESKGELMQFTRACTKRAAT